MGVSIDAEIYDIATMTEQFESFLAEHSAYRRENTVEPAVFLEKVMPNFGAVVGDKFVMVYNEYYEDYNPVLNFLESANTYYFGTNDLSSLLNVYNYIFDWMGGEDVTGGAEPLDVDSAAELGLDYPGRDLYDD